jgi:hypothetical protein
LRQKPRLSRNLAQDLRQRFTSIMPHNTAPAASATGTPAPIDGAGAANRQETELQIGLAWTVAAAMKKPLANVNDLIPPLRQILKILLSRDDY